VSRPLHACSVPPPNGSRTLPSAPGGSMGREYGHSGAATHLEAQAT
jgi:hypothetical protein